MGRPIQHGSTNQSTVVRIIDATDGTPETGVTSATTGLDLKYRREGGLTVDLTESDLTALNDAHSDGGMLHIGAGYYRVDLPDAACTSGAAGVLVFGTVTGMVIIGEYHPLVAYDPADSVRLGLTALPNAAADAAGGLPISDAGGLDLDARLDAAVSSRASSAEISALNDLSAAQVNAEVVDALNVDTYSEPGQGAPPATPTIREMLHYAYKIWRNKKDNDGTTIQLYNDAGTVVDQKQGVSESAGTVTKDEWVSGP